MPIVHISLARGNDSPFLNTLLHVTMYCIQQVLGLPADDRNIRLSEFDEGLFQTKPPYRLLIEISLFAGRTISTKRLLYKSIVHNLEQQLGISPDSVFIFLNEQPLENWGIRGGIPASDLDLGFAIER